MTETDDDARRRDEPQPRQEELARPEPHQRRLGPDTDPSTTSGSTISSDKQYELIRFEAIRDIKEAITTQLLHDYRWIGLLVGGMGLIGVPALTYTFIGTQVNTPVREALVKAEVEIAGLKALAKDTKATAKAALDDAAKAREATETVEAVAKDMAKSAEELLKQLETAKARNAELSAQAAAAKTKFDQVLTQIAQTRARAEREGHTISELSQQIAQRAELTAREGENNSKFLREALGKIAERVDALAARPPASSGPGAAKPPLLAEQINETTLEIIKRNAARLRRMGVFVLVVGMDKSNRYKQIEPKLQAMSYVLSFKRYRDLLYSELDARCDPDPTTIDIIYGSQDKDSRESALEIAHLVEEILADPTKTCISDMIPSNQIRVLISPAI